MQGRLVMLELLITSVILFGSGYGTRWYQEPTIEPLRVGVSEEYITPIGIRDCKEDIGAICPIQAPRWVLPSEEYLKLSGYIKGLRMELLECDNDKSEFNRLLDSE